MLGFVIAIVFYVQAAPAPKAPPPLIQAAEQGQTDAVRALLKRGADPSIRDNRGRAALHAAASSQQESTFDELLQFVSGPIRDLVPEIAKDSQVAAAEAVLAIERQNRILNAADENGSTVLMLAARNGWHDVVTTLVDHGANSTIQDKHGRSAADYAEAAGHSDIAKYLRELKSRNP